MTDPTHPVEPPLVSPPATGSIAADTPVAPPTRALTPVAAWSWVLGVVAVVALVVSGLLWQRLDRIQQDLARRAADMAADATAARMAAEQAQTLTQTLQARLAVAEVKLSEVSLQRSQLEELMLSMSRSRDDTLVLDIESGLRLAGQQAELTGSVQPLVSALLAADRRIAKAAQPRLNPVQRAVARDIERIRGVAVTDVPALLQRLDELGRLADELRPLNAPPRPKVHTPPTATKGPVAKVQSDKPAAAPVAGASNTLDEGETVAVPPPEGGWAQVSVWWQALWRKVTQRAAQTLGDLVRVGRIDRPEAVLLSPDQAFFLRENVKLKVLNARLGLLSRQLPTARTDLGTVRLMLTTYFDPQDPTTRQALQLVAEVLQASKSEALPRPEETLTALAAAAGGR